jgi:hypothetical protein
MIDGIGSALLVIPAMIAAGVRPMKAMEAVHGGTRKRARVDDGVIIARELSPGSPPFDGLRGSQWSRDRLHITGSLEGWMIFIGMKRAG